MKSFVSAILAATLLLLPVSGLSVAQVHAQSQPNTRYAASNAGIDSVQTSFGITGPGMNPGTGQCIPSVTFKGNAESMIAIDPSNPNHLVGTSHFIYKFAQSGGEFSGSVGVQASTDGGQTWSDHIITGFDCTNTNFKAKIFRTYDPVIAFDVSGNLYAAVLPDYGGGSGQNLPLYVAKSTDGGSTWSVANGGQPIFNPTSSAGSADKEWIILDNYQSSPFSGAIYVVWTAFHGYGNSEAMFARSTDGGKTFSKPKMASPAHGVNYGYAWAIPAVAPDGTLYVSFIGYKDCNTCDTVDNFVVKSTDGGKSFSSPSAIASTLWHAYPYPATTFRDGIYESFSVNPANGHLLFALEKTEGTTSCYGQMGECYAVEAADTNILLFESSNGGGSWSVPITVNDNPDEPTNQFQPVVSASPSGLVAVAFYDRRLPCAADPGVLPENIGKENHCIDTSIQFYTDNNTLTPAGQNTRVTKHSWDPNNPGSFGVKGDYLRFIGDYFGLALTDSMAYPFFTANYNLGQNSAQDMQIFVAHVKTPLNPIPEFPTNNISVTAAAVALALCSVALLRRRRSNGSKAPLSPIIMTCICR